MEKVKGVIFDWAGTTVDFGCFAPMHAFIRVFEEKGVPVSSREIRESMGLAKLDHIKALLEIPRIKRLWHKNHGREATYKDVNSLYIRFEDVLMDSLENFAQPLPKVLDTVAFLRKKSIKIGSTTGYTGEMMAIVAKEAKKRGYSPDSLVTPEQVAGLGRPYPYMIFKNMQNLGLKSTRSIIKIGDTCSDVKEAVNAGVWSVGCIIGSSELGLNKEEFSELKSKDRQEKILVTKERFLQAGADFVLEHTGEIPDLIEKVDSLICKKTLSYKH